MNATEKVFADFEAQADPSLVQDQHNASVLVRHIQANGGVFSVENLNAAVQAKANELHWWGSRVEKMESNPADNLPFADEPQLRGIRTMQDIKNMSADKLRRFMGPVDLVTHRGSDISEKFKARIAHIQKYNLQAAPSVEPTPQMTRAIAILNDPRVKDCLARIENLVIGTYAKNLSVRKVIKDDVIKMANKGEKPEAIVRLVDAQIASYAPNSSIR